MHVPRSVIGRVHPIVCVLMLALPCVGQGVDEWLERKPAKSPPGTHRHAMCFDPLRGVAVVFGGGSGNAASTLYDTTWEWDGSTWVQRTPKAKPSKRHTFGMSFCPNLKEVLLFGGHDEAKYLADTWSWNGKIWTRHAPTTSPTARRSHLLAADTQRGRVVLFGGNQGGKLLNDTWEWNGKTWAKRSPAVSPPPLHGYAIAFDERRGKTVLFGGADTKGNTNQTWEWGGTNWKRVATTTAPTPRGNNSMVYDRSRQRIVLFGGSLSSGSYSNETWSFDGKAWTKLKTGVSPAGRDAHAMAYDTWREQVVLFAGIRARSDTWILYRSGFSVYGAGCARTGTPPALRAPTAPRLGQPLTIRISGLAKQTAGQIILGTSDATWMGASLPLDLSFLGVSGCNLLTSWDAEIPIFSQAGGDFDWSAQVPNLPALLAFRFYSQAWTLEPGTARFGATTNGGRFVIGR